MKIKNLHVYQLENVEVDWDNLVRCEEYRSKLATIYVVEPDPNLRQAHLATLQKLEEFYVAAMEASRGMGSRGHFLVKPHVGFIPTGHRISAYLIWTDDDHGSMYVASPVEMPHLDVEGSHIGGV
jgi:hypothetical protein